MPNSQRMSYPSTDWSSEISDPTGGCQSTAHTASTTSTTTTTTSSTSVGHPSAAAGSNVTTTITNQTAAAPMAQNPFSMQTQPPMQAQSPMQSQSSMQGQPSMQTQTPMQGQPSMQPQTPMQGQPSMQTQTPMQGQPSAQNQAAMQGAGAPSPAHRDEFTGSSGTLDLETHQPIEVIEAPASMNEAFLGSMKSMLMRNRGSFVTATFLIGTQGTTTWEGILHDVGNDHIIIFQPGRQRYIACDIYALKYIEFYDTRQRDACVQLLRQSGLNSDMNRGMNSFY